MRINEGMPIRRGARNGIKFRLLSVTAIALLMGASQGFGQTTSPLVEEAKKIVAAASEAKTNAPDLPPIHPGEALKGKSIFYISAGLSFPFSQEVLKGVQDGSAVLGMTVSTADAMGDSSKASSYIDRALGQGAAAIVLQGIDPYTVQASIKDATAAGIPVISTAALPEATSDIAEAGLAANVTSSISEYAKWLAAYVAASAEPDAHVGLIFCSTFRTDAVLVEEFTAELARLCPSCQLTVKDAPLVQWDTTLPSLIRTMVTVDPKLSYFVSSVDAMVPSIKPAIIAVGASDRIKIATGNASLPDMQAIATKTDQEAANIGSSNERMGWATVDQVARLLTGQPAVTAVQPQRLFTIENIDQIDLKAVAASWYGFDFRSYYSRLWGF
jgi:ribose transport system substrate-binding protein